MKRVCLPGSTLWTTAGSEDRVIQANADDRSGLLQVRAREAILSLVAGRRRPRRGHYLGKCGKTNQRGLPTQWQKVITTTRGLWRMYLVESKLFCSSKRTASFSPVGGRNTDHSFSSTHLLVTLRREARVVTGAHYPVVNCTFR